MKNDNPQSSDIIFYSSPDGVVRVEVFFQEETFWLSQKKMAELFGVDVRTINEHLQNIYSSGELEKDRTIRNFRIVQKEGKRDVTREVDFYNLDAIIAVGYRVNSFQATQFRIWSTKTLSEFVIKGFVLDDERLKQGQRFGMDYFDELLERIREIRASERRFYLKITDIYEQCSIDYSKDSALTQTFFKTVQNKLHWAITGKTTAQIISERASATKPRMGLKTWKNAPKGKILKSDVSVAKNYLIEKEIKELERVVTMYLDYAENQAAKQVPMKMADWILKLDAFLQFNEYEILKDAGKVQHEIAKQLAEKEYAKYRVKQDNDFQSDFEVSAAKAVYSVSRSINKTQKIATKKKKPAVKR
ncbi:MAG TPA: virulence RhuM family protein [Bacteroidia bacterium]|nr:virulence RhuM family protein [Bacteroidia bacterium]